MSFTAQDFDYSKIIATLDERTQAVIKKHFIRYFHKVHSPIKVITIVICLAPTITSLNCCFPNAKIVLD